MNDRLPHVETEAEQRGGFRALVLVACLLVPALLILPLLPQPAISTPGWLAWIGRLHPLLVHFPAALVPFLAACEIFLFWKKDARRPLTMRLLWIVVLGSAIAAVSAGYLLYVSGDYRGEISREHFWGAVLTASFLIGAALFNEWSLRGSRTTHWGYAGLLGLSVLGVVYTGHHGGMLTHGASFLSEAAPIGKSLPAPFEGPREELTVLEDLILPAFELRCVTCHNADKTKGGLQLTSFQTIQVGGDSETPLFVSGDVSASELHRRITLPADDDDYMPPEGKTPLSDVEIDLIAWWIEQGANPDMRYGSGPADSTRAARFEVYVTNQMQARRRRIIRRGEALEMAESMRKQIGALNVDIDPDLDGTTLAVSMKIPPEHVDDNTVADLVAYDAYITSLSLVGSDISDDALYHIGRLPALRSLYIAYNAIDGSGLLYLRDAPYLERLNLSHTELTSEAVLHLTRIPSLKEVYLYDTRVDSVMIEALRSFLPDVDIALEEGPLHHGV